MIEIGRRMRAQPAPPHIVREALMEPDRDPSRPWLDLLSDEFAPVVSAHGDGVRWTSLWPTRPDAVLLFELPTDGGGGTALCWTLLVDEPVPSDELVGHLRKRVNTLINAKLRYSFGQ